MGEPRDEILEVIAGVDEWAPYVPRLRAASFSR
jgi:hypothetical protein